MTIKGRILGFSLMETMISVAVFGVIMLLIFQISNVFFKTWRKQDEQQDINRDFIKIYISINRELSRSDTGYIACYDNDGTGADVEKKWFLFPVATDDGNTIQCDGDGLINWTKIIIYYLIPPKDDDCPSVAKCTHKRLIRASYAFKSPNALRFGTETPLDLFVKNVSKVLVDPSSKYPDIKGLTFIDSKLIAQNLLNFSMTCKRKGRVEFKMDMVKLEDAKKSVNIKTFDFNSTEGRRYIESLGWTTFTM